jgi:hypothetical protein
VNCAGDYCQNKFMDQIIYKTFYIKDSKIEDIDCIFFDFINYLENIFTSSDARILIHCVLGVSRSVTLSMAFLMHSYKMTFRHCFNFVKDKRGVASPNLGFVSQLLSFEKRINTLSELQVSNNLKIAHVFVFGTHQKEDPEYFVFRRVDPYKMLSFNSNSSREINAFGLDPRAVLLFISKSVKTETSGYLWIGTVRLTFFVLINRKEFPFFSENSYADVLPIF